VSELLKNGLQNAQKEVEAGIAQAEAELGRLRHQCEQLEELIAVGKATLYAAQLKPSFGARPAEKPSAKLSNGRAAADASADVVKELQNHLT
jgi:hypothetical protein